MSSASVSIVIPVYNELANLDELITRLIASCDAMGRRYEVILVDDGSSDGSGHKLEVEANRHRGRIVAVLLNRNYGQHAAVMAGFQKSLGDYVVTLDADLQNPPEEIPRLVEAIAEGFDVVGSVRRHRRDSLLRRVSSVIVNTTARRTTGVMMTDYGCMLRAYSRRIVDAMLECPERSTFIPILANGFARKTREIEVGHAARSAGRSKYGLWKLINLQFDLLTSVTTFPLRALSLAGTAISVGGIGFGTTLIALRLYFGPAWAAEGIFSLFALLFVFVGAQFIAMGLLGEYIGRVYHDVRARPRFFVDRVEGTSELDRGAMPGEVAKLGSSVRSPTVCHRERPATEWSRT